MTITYYDLNHIYRYLFSFTTPPTADMLPVSPPGGTINPTASTSDPGTILYTSGTHQIIAIPVYPYNIYRDPTHNPPDPAIINGINTIQINEMLVSPQYRFIHYLGIYDSGWISSNSVSGIPDGKYLCLARDSGAITHITFAEGIAYAPLTYNATKNDVSYPAGTDGQVTVKVLTGSGNYTITWWDATTTNLTSGEQIQSATRINLAAGVYPITLHDNLSGAADFVFDIVITEPIIEIEKETYFNVPRAQSLEFVHEITPDGSNSFQNLDNVRYCHQDFPYFKLDPYFQKIAVNDKPITIQWQSNYDSHTVELFSENNILIDSLPSSLKVQNIGVAENFDITLRDNGGGQTRVYFHSTIFPIPIKVGDVFGINNNVDGFDGNYVVLVIGLDVTRGSQYFTINVPYTIIPDSSEANGVFFVSEVNFNIFESIIDFSIYDEGNYYIKIAPVVTVGANQVPALSESIQLALSFIGTNVIKFKNVDNAWDIDYSTGIVNFLRIESNFFKRKPKSIIDTTRNTTGELYKTRALKQRGVEFEIIMLPPYLHEKLSIVFDCDYFEINGKQYVTDQPYSDPDYLFNYGLSNSSITLEQFGWMKTYNTDDLAGQFMPDDNRIQDNTFDGTFN